MTATATTNGAPLLELRGVSKRFGAVHALSDVDFTVRAGEVVGLVGDNGAGKSTLVKVMSGIYLADGGEYRFEDQVRTVHSPVDATALGVATVYQDLALCDNLDVVANLFIGREEISNGPAGALRSLDEATMEQQAVEMLDRQPLEMDDVGRHRRDTPVAEHVGDVLRELHQAPAAHILHAGRPPVERFAGLEALGRGHGAVREAARVELDVRSRPGQGSAERVVGGGREGRRIDDVNAHGNGQ